MWEIASPDQRARSFVTVFATLQGGYEMFCHSYQLQAMVNMVSCVACASIFEIKAKKKFQNTYLNNLLFQEVPPPFEGMNGFVNGFSPLTGGNS